MPADASIYLNNLTKFDPFGSALQGYQQGVKLKDLALQQQQQQEDRQLAKEDRSRRVAREDETDAYTKQKRLEEAKDRETQEYGRIFGQVKDQAGYDAAKGEWQRLGYSGLDKMSPAYDPKQHKQMLSATMSYQEQLAKQREAAKEAREAELFGLTKQKTKAEIGRLDAEAAKDRAKAGVGAGVGQKLSADKVLKVQEGDSVAQMLPAIQQTLEANADSFGPLAGRMGSLNPYNEKAQTIDAQMRASSQAFGRFMEGGVLRKEDEEKYRKMFPNLSDPPEIAKNKLAIVNKLLVDKQGGDLNALSKAGYDVSPFQRRESPALPKVLNAHPQDNEAVAWAKANPQDPRSAAILQANGVR